MIADKVHIAIVDSKKLSITAWLMHDNQADLRESFQRRVKLPVSLESQGGEPVSAGTFWIGREEARILATLIDRLPPQLAPYMKVSRGRTDNHPTEPTFDEWLSSLNLTRL